MGRPFTTTALLTTTLTALALCGCDGGSVTASVEAQPAPFTVRAADMDVDAIPDGPVAGELSGEAFELEEAVFRVETMERRERVDLWLADQRSPQCGVPLPTDARKVWLRFDGITDLEPGLHRIEADEASPITLHYELPLQPAGWRAAAGGAALLVLDTVDEHTVAGRVRACFDDGAGSCVEGRFHAERCGGPLDVDDDVSGAGVLSRDMPGPPIPR